MRDSLVFYRSFHDALTELDPVTYKEVMEAIIDYALDEKIPKLTGVSKMAFTLIKPQIDANNRRAEVGKLGGRPKKTIGFESENHRLEDEKPNVNVNVNDNANTNRQKSKNKFCNFKQSDIDMDELSKKVFVN